MGRDRRGDLEWFAFYYDPIEREAATFPDHATALAPLVTLPYSIPSAPTGAMAVRAVRPQARMEQPEARINEFIPDPRAISIALLMAHELGDDITRSTHARSRRRALRASVLRRRERPLRLLLRLGRSIRAGSTARC